ncbi:MAG: hypothetical protein Devi2KO_01160 [Devosia indica]
MDQGIVGAAGASKVEFDLLENPFVLLRLSPDATKEDIAEAFDEATAEAWADDEVLRNARRHLLAPKLRLGATVDMLVDATPQQRDLAISALRDGVPLSDLIALAKDLPSASRAVYLSNIAQLRPSSGALRFFAITLAAIDRPEFAAKIGELFEGAGLPPPSAANIAEAFEESTARNVRRLFSAYQDAKAASADIRRCVDEGIPTSTDDQLAAYTSLITAYQEFAASEILELRHRVTASSSKLLENTSDSAAMDLLEADLRSWDELTQPAQLLAQRKGRDDVQSRELFEHLRGFMITLANEKNAAAVALRLSKVCTEVFAELPRAAAQLKEDLGALQGLVDQEGARELVEFIEKLRADLDPLVSDLRRGFGLSANGNARRLYLVFDKAVSATKGTDVGHIPWLMVRGLALDINNDLGEGAASEVIISGLINHAGFKDASQDVRTAIRTDHQTLQMNAAQARLKRAVDRKDNADARLALQTMVGLATEESEKRQYQQAIANLESAKRGRIFRWAFWGVIAIVAIIAISNQGNSRSSSSYSSSSSRPPASTNYTKPAQTAAPVTNQEVMPAAYSAATFSRGNLRYCKFQNARLDAIDQMMINESNRMIDRFNEAVDDYNSRCASYEYYVDDMTAVQRELNANQAKISADARTIMQGWRMNN